MLNRRKEIEEIRELKEQIDTLEKEHRELEHKCIEWFCSINQYIKDSVDGYFREKCQMVIVKRDEDEIIAQIKKQTMGNLFRKEDD